MTRNKLARMAARVISIFYPQRANRTGHRALRQDYSRAQKVAVLHSCLGVYGGLAQSPDFWALRSSFCPNPHQIAQLRSLCASLPDSCACTPGVHLIPSLGGQNDPSIDAAKAVRRSLAGREGAAS